MSLICAIYLWYGILFLCLTEIHRHLLFPPNLSSSSRWYRIVIHEEESEDEKQDGDVLLTNALKTNTAACNVSTNEAINTNNNTNIASLVTLSFDIPSIASKNYNKRKVNGNMNSEERGKSKKGTSAAKPKKPRGKKRWKGTKRECRQ